MHKLTKAAAFALGVIGSLSLAASSADARARVQANPGCSPYDSWCQTQAQTSVIGEPGAHSGNQCWNAGPGISTYQGYWADCPKPKR